MEILLIDHEVASQIFTGDVAHQNVSFADEKSNVSFSSVVTEKFISHSLMDPK